jgi:hypothetical protein
MSKSLHIATNVLAVIHRCIWRLGIFAWIGILLYAASRPNDRSLGHLFS